MAVEWGYYKKFEHIMDKYLPDVGEGETMATQIVTATTKLIYKWYNDGDVYDNTYQMQGWWNDLSSYANWIYKYVGGETGADTILEGIKDCYNDSEYEDLLKELADTLLDDEWWLELYQTKETAGSIYKCDGWFKFEENEDDEW